MNSRTSPRCACTGSGSQVSDSSWSRGGWSSQRSRTWDRCGSQYGRMTAGGCTHALHSWLEIRYRFYLLHLGTQGVKVVCECKGLKGIQYEGEYGVLPRRGNNFLYLVQGNGF